MRESVRERGAGRGSGGEGDTESVALDAVLAITRRPHERSNDGDVLRPRDGNLRRANERRDREGERGWWKFCDRCVEDVGGEVCTSERDKYLRRGAVEGRAMDVRRRLDVKR